MSSQGEEDGDRAQRCLRSAVTMVQACRLRTTVLTGSSVCFCGCFGQSTPARLPLQKVTTAQTAASPAASTSHRASSCGRCRWRQRVSRARDRGTGAPDPSALCTRAKAAARRCRPCIRQRHRRAHSRTSRRHSRPGREGTTARPPTCRSHTRRRGRPVPLRPRLCPRCITLRQCMWPCQCTMLRRSQAQDWPSLASRGAIRRCPDRRNRCRHLRTRTALCNLTDSLFFIDDNRTAHGAAKSSTLRRRIPARTARPT